MENLKRVLNIIGKMIGALQHDDTSLLFSAQTLNDIFYDSDCVTDITLYLAITTR